MAATSAPPQVDAVTKRRFTVHEYYRMAEAGILSEDDRVELIEGEIVQLSPIGSRYADVVNELEDRIRSAVGSQARVRGQSPIRLLDDTEPEPDPAVVTQRRYGRAHPTAQDIHLLVEVSDTSLHYDRDRKLPLYARAGIPEVWIVAIDSEQIMGFTEPRDDGYRIVEAFRAGEVITSIAVPEGDHARADVPDGHAQWRDERRAGVPLGSQEHRRRLAALVRAARRCDAVCRRCSGWLPGDPACARGQWLDRDTPRAGVPALHPAHTPARVPHQRDPRQNAPRLRGSNTTAGSAVLLPDDRLADPDVPPPLSNGRWLPSWC